MNKYFYVTVIFFVGVSVTLLELASARLVAPFFGSTIYVWGAAIGTILAALAIGYWLGGRWSERFDGRKLLGSMLFISSLTAALVPLIYEPLLHSAISDQLAGVPFFLIVMGSMLLLFFIPVACLGAMSPVVLRLAVTSLHETGPVSGLLSGMNTFGSICGTFLAAFVTVPAIGVRWTILLAAGLLATLGLVVWPKQRLWVFSTFLIVGLSMAMTSVTPFITRADLIWNRESPYQFVQVFLEAGRKYLVIDAAHGAQSVYDPGTAVNGTYVDSYAMLPYLTSQTDRQRRVLLVGLGGGSTFRLFHEVQGDTFDFAFTAVELDPAVTAAAKEEFGLNQLPVRVIHDDARHYLATTDEQYDIIIVDAYINELQIPPMLATVEFFQEVQSRLRPGGLAAFNMVRLAGERYGQKLLQTAASVFPHVVSGPVQPGSGNEFILLGDGIDVTRVRPTGHAELDREVTQTLGLLHPVARTADPVFTDDRTDLELRLRPRG
ncbi:MAG: fused MFS/spermidine synthase [Candidatus Kerfeldbacteria bacterium]|nr:fused MFS/spermidine synthase [Candidatus Kerfeldbacteria bacterium]